MPHPHRVALLAVVLTACGDPATEGDTGPLFPVDSFGGDVQVTDTATGPRCGDGVVEGDEACDEGVANGLYYHCAADCSGPGPRCGDGQVDAGYETCDDGDGVNGQYGHCGAGCNGPAPYCGNGFTEAAHEVCDDGEDNGDYGSCTADCSAPGPRCGDGVVDSPWELCDDGSNNGHTGYCAYNCTASPGCGDGDVVAPEACDDGADNGLYGHCAADCAGPGPFCGDGVADKGVEACDHGEDNGRYGHCRADCAGLGPRCGDGTIDADHERCDDGADNGTVGHCRLDCSAIAAPWEPLPTASDAAAVRDGRSCDTHDWLAKYMRYRRRFRGDGTAAYPGFISLGTDAGQSMPASRREPHVACEGYWGFEGCPRAADPSSRGLYKWGDGTIWHGHYLEVLATEYAVFVELGLDPTETLNDIRLALAAFDRVDEAAEGYYGVAPARDGFFLRDDVPADFMGNENGYRFPRADGYAGYGCASADVACEPPTIDGGAFTSQDQVVGMTLGLAAVATFVPSGVTSQGVDLNMDAREKIHRMINTLRNDGWKVLDPEGEHPPDAWGGNVIGFSNQLAKAANRYCGEDFGVSDYRTLASRIEGEAAWVGLQAIWSLTLNFNRTMALKLASMTAVWSIDKLSGRAVGDTKDYYAVLAALMNDTRLPDDFSEWRMESVLDSAPCGGPCRGYASCDAGNEGWKGESRIFGPRDRIGSRYHPEAEFNGLDYMAIHNVWFLYKRGQLGYATPAPPSSGCTAFKGLDALREDGDAVASYDPTAACAASDLRQRFCGRPFSSWIDDAYRGRVTLFIGGARWTCSDGQPCVITGGGDVGSGGDDLILGGSGADHLKGGGGNDCLYGGAGDDLLEGGQGYDELHGGDGADRLYGEGDGWIILDGERDELWGEAGDDVLEGGPDGDALYGGEGNDTMAGGGGDDLLEGGPGHDDMHGNDGDDVMSGGDGDDRMIGDGGADTLWGDAGRDKLDGESGDDSCDGGTGDDFVRGGTGDDTLIAGLSGHDRLCGNGGDDVLWGGWDGDECHGGGFLGGHDTVNGCDDDTATSDDCDNGAFDAW
ncbi:MAG: calcium-binding protein [Deltaproteobacteria bacterium]|nr:MAG: calcium-binding protein [Deltaproteobacteria bacterium]